MTRPASPDAETAGLGAPATAARTAEDIADELACKGWCITDDFLPAHCITGLRESAEGRWRLGKFRQAAIGRGEARGQQRDVRSDETLWLDPAKADAAEEMYWERMEALRLAVNQRLYLGLYELEAHFALFPPGAYYRRHLDQFRGAEHRQLSTVLYLNDAWREADDGTLRLYLPSDDGSEQGMDVTPLGGRLVTFLSADLPHEVLPARRRRYSLTGWFRRRL